jgi:hypothetical protein
VREEVADEDVPVAGCIERTVATKTSTLEKGKGPAETRRSTEVGLEGLNGGARVP